MRFVVVAVLWDLAVSNEVKEQSDAGRWHCQRHTNFKLLTDASNTAKGTRKAQNLRISCVDVWMNSSPTSDMRTTSAFWKSICVPWVLLANALPCNHVYIVIRQVPGLAHMEQYFNLNVPLIWIWMCMQAHLRLDQAASLFQKLDNNNMFQKQALFYIGWAMVLEKTNKWEETDQIFALGFER